MKARVILSIALVTTFVAGTSVGVLIVRQAEPRRGADPREAFHEKLGLSEAQREQMSEIWGQALRERMQEIDRERRAPSKQRDAEIRALYTDAQREQVDQIRASYDERSKVLSDAKRQAFEQARQATRAVLTEDQRAKFDEMLAQRRSHDDRSRRDGDRDGDRGGWRDRERPDNGPLPPPEREGDAEGRSTGPDGPGTDAGPAQPAPPMDGDTERDGGTSPTP